MSKEKEEALSNIHLSEPGVPYFWRIVLLHGPGQSPGLTELHGPERTGWTKANVSVWLLLAIFGDQEESDTSPDGFCTNRRKYEIIVLY